MSIETILDTMDEMLEKAWGVPLSGGKCMVDSEKLRDMIDEIRLNLPTEIRQAKAIAADRNNILLAARNEAEGIIRRAEERAKSLVAQEEIVRAANEKATETLNAAQAKSKEMRQAAFDFSEEMLGKIEQSAMACLSNVRDTKQALKTNKAGK